MPSGASWKTTSASIVATARRTKQVPQAHVSKVFDDCGFLETPDGREIYFHRNKVLNDGFVKLRVGTHVRFVEEEGNQGPQAGEHRHRGGSQALDRPWRPP
ncbi:MAG TPA: cold shock domain-containing protein [Candidatus Binataceae bacterium]|jgi:cold shock CspA family protein|nr:cold shock domain-containing protein [Candidatus Binataceae bacterium]